jgi:hypothetical protein
MLSLRVIANFANNFSNSRRCASMKNEVCDRLMKNHLGDIIFVGLALSVNIGLELYIMIRFYNLISSFTMTMITFTGLLIIRSAWILFSSARDITEKISSIDDSNGDSGKVASLEIAAISFKSQLQNVIILSVVILILITRIYHFVVELKSIPH